MPSNLHLPLIEKIENENPGSASALLAALANLSQHQFSDEQELKAAILNAIAEQLQVRTPSFSTNWVGKLEPSDSLSSLRPQI